MKKKIFLLACLLSPSIMLHGAMTQLNDQMAIGAPSYFGSQSVGAQTFTSVLIDADFEKVGGEFIYPSTVCIDTIFIRTGVVTTGDTLDWRLETVGKGSDGILDGVPTDTLAYSNSSGTVVINGLQDNTLMQSGSIVNTSSDCTSIAGSVVALTLGRISGGAFNGNINFNYAAALSDFPLRLSSNSTVGWAKTGTYPNFALKLKDGSFPRIPGVTAYDNATSTLATATTNIFGNKIIPLFKHRVIGARIEMDTDNPSTIYMQVGGSTITAISLSTGTRTNANSDCRIVMFPPPILPSQTVLAGQNYYLFFSTGNGTANTFWVYEGTTSAFANGMYDQTMPMGNSVIGIRSMRFPTSEASWSVDTAKRYSIWPIIDQVDLSPNQINIYNSNLRNTTLH